MLGCASRKLTQPKGLDALSGRLRHANRKVLVIPADIQQWKQDRLGPKRPHVKS